MEQPGAAEGLDIPCTMDAAGEVPPRRRYAHPAACRRFACVQATKIASLSVVVATGVPDGLCNECDGLPVSVAVT